LLGNVTLGQEARHENMTVYPIFVEAESEFGYLSLDEALEKRLVEVTELSEAGDVPNLKIFNHGPTPILILAGEELVGAKQNRVVNATFLVMGGVSLTIPVSCVEQGRWSYQTREFSSEKRMHSPGLRSRMEEDVQSSVREHRGFRANQGKVWHEIAAKMDRMGVHSETEAMAALYQAHDGRLRDYTGRFTVEENQGGFLVALNGRVAGLEILDSGNSLGKYFGKLIQSYALDALDARLQEETSRPEPDHIEDWLTEVLESPVSLVPSLGLGQDLRLSGEKVIGSGLLHEETVLYFSAFPKAGGGESNKPRSSMARASRRRRFDA